MWNWLLRLFGVRCGGGQQSPSPPSPAVSAGNSRPEPPGLMEARTLRNLATLDAGTRRLAEALVERMWQVDGLDFRVTSGTRTMAEQQALYDQGRTKPGKIVTNAKPGYSWHNFGVAFDVTLFRAGQPVWSGPEYDAAGRAGEALGLEWGGRWTGFADRPHFQRKTGLTLAEARARHAKGVAV